MLRTALVTLVVSLAATPAVQTLRPWWRFWD